MPDIIEETVELDIDSVSLDDLSDVNVDDVDLSDFAEVDTTIEYPHVKVSSKAFKDFLKVARQICAAGGRDIVSKAVCLKADPSTEKLVCRATDFDVYVEMGLELLNEEKILTDSVQVSTDTLIKLSKAVPSNLIIYRDDNGKFRIRLYGGDMDLETYSFGDDKYTFSDKVNRVASIQSTDLFDVIKDFSPVVSAAVNPVERRIMCRSDCAVANYMWSVICDNKPFADFDLKVKDINVLKLLLSNKENEALSVYETVDSTVERCVIEGVAFKYAFLVSDTTASDKLKSDIDKVVTDEGVYVDYQQLFKMIEVASELPYAVGKVGMNYSPDGLVIDIKTKTGSNVFNIIGQFEGSPVPLKKELEVQSKLFRVILKSFGAKASVRLSFNDLGLGVFADDYSAALYSETN